MANAANITRRRALTSIAVIPVCGVATSAGAEPLDALSEEEIDRRIGELANEISDLLPRHPIYRLGNRAWHVRIDAAGHGYSARRKEPHDPLIDAIAAYGAGTEAYGNHPVCKTVDVTDAEREAAIAATYGPPLARLEAWDQPAVSREGAIAALRFAALEISDFVFSRAVEAMVWAALGYFASLPSGIAEA